MKANELKCSNYVYLTKDSFKTQEIRQLDCFDIYKLSENNCEDIKPIPLAGEILLKCGFFRQPWGLVLNELVFKDNLKCTELKFMIGNGFNVKIKYLHQLQNLYFALTNKELEINI